MDAKRQKKPQFFGQDDRAGGCRGSLIVNLLTGVDRLLLDVILILTRPMRSRDLWQFAAQHRTELFLPVPIPA